MDNQQQQQQPPSGVPGPTGRRLHIAHRRSPSEMTPMIMEQLALQQQIELLQQQQQQIAATHQQYVNMGMIPQQQQLPGIVLPGQQGPGQGQMNQGMPQFQFPPQMQQQQQQGGMGGLNQSAHRRNQSAMPNMGNLNMGGPPPAPSSGAAGGGLEYTGGQQQQQQQQQQSGQRGGRGGGGGHQRRHSLALPEAKKAAELAQSKRTPSGFQFPIPGAGGNSPGGRTDNAGEGEEKSAQQSGLSAPLQARPGNRMAGAHGRSQSMAVGGRGMAQGRGGTNFQFPPPMATNDAGASGSQRGAHGRSASRNFDGNWRQPSGESGGDGQQPMGSFSSSVNPQAPSFQPGHRARPSMNQSISGMGAFQFPGQQQMMMNPQQQQMLQMQSMFQGGQLNPLQVQQLQALQAAGLSPQQIFGNLAPGQQQGGLAAPGQNQQQRKTLFTPYLPQATLPALLGDGQLVQGILRVNKKNRSDAYVTCPELDADIFICGSKDRNRALEGDLVAIELLDVDEVWSQKKEKEEKKKRKDITDTRSSGLDKSDSTHGGQANGEGGLKRRGSLRQRPTQKKNDDVEVEGQSLLLMEEEEINDEAKPLYAGHVVAVIERIAGQMFSGTLGLLRPSSQATKEKQEAERAQRDGSTGRHSQDRHQDKPKIVWFKPTDKRVPLIAIPTEQAPRDFVERHQEYANRIFVACIKRWPITSLHPFGTLVEQLGEMGDLKVETDALLRDNNFGPDDFSDAVMKNIGFEDWSVSKESEDALAKRRDFREETIFTIDPTGTEALDDALHIKDLGNGEFEVGVHVADAAHFVKQNSLVDREARKRGTGVFLMTRAVNMLPQRLANDICSLSPKEDRFTVSVVFQVDGKTGNVDSDKTWVGKSIINSSGRVTYDEVDAVIAGKGDTKLQGASAKEITTLKTIAQKLRQARYQVETENIPSLRLLYQLDDENVPVQSNIFNTSPAHNIIEELSYLANSVVAEKIYAALPDKALLRRHATPKAGRLQTFGERMTKAGYEIDTTSSGTLQNSLFKIKDTGMRQGMETLLVKTMPRAKYVVPAIVGSEHVPHFALNLPVYTHFTNPSRRYADIVVHRQLEAALNAAEGEQAEYPEDIEALSKLVEQCNTKKDSAQAAQEQSVHIEACRAIDKKRVALGADLITEGIVICVYESAFDVLIPEYGFEKRVHCDQLPLHKAEFRKESRVLELYWEKGVSSSAYVPEDERAKNTGSKRYGSQQSAAEAKAADDAHRNIDSHAISTDDVDALFEDDDDAASEVTEMTAGVSLNPAEQTQSVPHSPKRNSQDGLPRTQSAIAIRDGKNADGTTDTKSKYMSWFKLREEDGSYIQDVTEMTRVPIILKTDLTKSPPCLTIRSVNPYGTL